MDLWDQKFGIEIEQTGITRYRAAHVIADYFGTHSKYIGGTYDKYVVPDQQGREWKFVSDSSIDCERRERGHRVSESEQYAVELVSPICTYQDIELIQELVRQLRHAGAITNSSAGIHIHIDGTPFDARTLRNLVNIVYAKEDLIYRALQVNDNRARDYCQKTDPLWVDNLNRLKPNTLEDIRKLWYGDDIGESYSHYHSSRYHCLNLHSYFQKGTIEFRAFNSGDSGSMRGTIHAGIVKAYIQFCLAISAQALNQRYASPVKSQTDNDKYSFRVWLLRLGMIGDEFKTARYHLLRHLDGCIAWRDPAQAIRQKERLLQKKYQNVLENSDSSSELIHHEEQQTESTMLNIGGNI